MPHPHQQPSQISVRSTGEFVEKCVIQLSVEFLAVGNISCVLIMTVTFSNHITETAFVNGECLSNV